MYDLDKTDQTLGLRVSRMLKELGIETPIVKPDHLQAQQAISTKKLNLKRLAKISEIEGHFRSIMNTLELDLTDDSLADTPMRMAKMYVNELYYGLDYTLFPKCTTVDNKIGYDEMVTISDISVMSACEHHGATIHGKAVISYIPGTKILGLSKFNRVVDFFCRRPQIQERLTAQIYHALSLILETDNIAVHIVADHFCVKSRGAQDNSKTTTVKLHGAFRKPEVRSEFMTLVSTHG
jgi:GTP cyclohydrolase I